MSQTVQVATRKTSIVHPKPTLTVIKQLYGTAFRCGEPECRKPLYRVNDETGDTVLNSEVAHIHARSEGGPRWKEGMTADENRSPNNLIPLCFEHAWEIDNSEDEYPADLLRSWKAAQLAECIVVQKSWSLTDAEAEEIEHRSFQAREHGHAAASAATVMQAVTEAGVLGELARSLRRGPSTIAHEWRQRHRQANVSSRMYDAQTGERLEAELSRGERRELAARLSQELTTACTALEAQAAKVKGLALALSVDPHLTPWCGWLERSVDDVVLASGRWPAGGTEDDDTLETAVGNLRTASLTLGRKSRGEEVGHPPEVESKCATAPVESEPQRLAREHREVLESARRWARVDHLAYDADVYRQLLNAMPYAVDLPPLMDLLPWSLDATARLAARVARNADDATLLALVEEARTRAPMSVASDLLWNLQKVAEGSSRVEIAERASAALVEVLRDETWQGHQTWVENQFHCRHLLMLCDHFVGMEHVHDRLRTALESDPTLIRPMLIGLAQWGESRDFDDFSVVLGLTCGIRELPDWLPRDALVDAIHTQMPQVVPSDHVEGSEPDPERLAAQFLYQSSLRDGV